MNQHNVSLARQMNFRKENNRKILSSSVSNHVIRLGGSEIMAFDPELF
jgi:hypothetical protein